MIHIWPFTDDGDHQLNVYTLKTKINKNNNKLPTLKYFLTKAQLDCYEIIINKNHPRTPKFQNFHLQLQNNIINRILKKIVL